MTDKKRMLFGWALNVVTSALWAASCIVNTVLAAKICAALLCVLHGFLAGMLFVTWKDM